MMKLILNNFFWVYRFLNKNIIIVSKLVGRIGRDVGADLLSYMYNDLGLSNKALIYADNPIMAT
jgi:hypothetical protein